MPSPPKPIGTKQAAEILGVDEATVSRYAAAGVLAFKRLPSGVRRFQRADVEALLSPSSGAGPRPAPESLAACVDMLTEHTADLEPGQRIRLVTALNNTEHNVP